MRLKMKTRQEVTAVTAGQYRGARKKEKRVLLDQFVSTTGYSSWYARFVLRHEGRRVQVDKQTILLAVRCNCNRILARPESRFAYLPATGTFWSSHSSAHSTTTGGRASATGVIAT